MRRAGSSVPVALVPFVAMSVLTACGGGGDGTDGSNDVPPFDMQTGVAATDLDGDDRPDLVVTNDGIDAKGSGITVLLADPASPGQFSPGTFHAMSDIARMTCIADFDGDDRPDFAVAAMVPRLVNDYESVVQLYLQDPAQPGHFVRGGRYDSGDLADFIAVADLDGDGLPDVVSGEGPQVLYSDSAQPGKLQAVRPL